ncbi:MAG: putative bifunctional diguanylate cyclase/phosphodiesterase [Solirubrobacteraceae bacterium]
MDDDARVTAGGAEPGGGRPASVSGRRLRRRWAGRPGVAGRLLVAVLLPITILAIAAGVLLSERYATSRQASSVAGEIVVLNRLVTLRSLLDQERLPVEASLRARQLGFDIPNIASIAGVSTVSESGARAAVDAQLRLLGPAVPAGFTSGLEVLRRRIDRSQITATPADVAFNGLSNMALGAFAARLSVLQQGTAKLSQAADLNRALSTLSDAGDALAASGSESSELSDVYVSAGAQRASALSSLGAQIALFDQASSRLRDAAGPARAAFVALQRNRLWQQFESAVAAAPAGAAVPGSAVASSAGASALSPALARLLPLGDVFRSGMSGIQQLFGLVAKAELGVHDSAVSLRESSADALRTLLIETLIAVALTIAVALLLARSITRPLRRLEDRARAVSAGDLELPLLPASGPKETVVVSQTFNDLVCNLRLMEAKARALAECSFEDPVLAEPLPGRLGEALRESVLVLSGSIVERESLQHRLAHQATHDVLTGLHNRAAANEFLEQALARCGRSGQPLAVLFIDLDDFKRANDTHGHAIGDAILKQIARRMTQAARRGDFLARLGGDEFLVIAEGIGDGAEASAIGARLVAAASQPIDVDDLRVSVGACVGITFALDAAAEEPSQLLARADLAVYRAKRAGHSRVEVYDESMQQALIARAQLEQALHATLDRGGEDLFLEYQPVIDATSGKLSSVEALVRWNRAGKPCLPDEFIPVAEQSDLIIRLDCWVLATALAQQQRWRHSGLGDVSIAINISGRHLLSGQLTDHVSEALTASQVKPTQLILELTETVLLTDLPTVALEMQRLRSLGVRMAIDDFGTGYTSLAHLQHLTVDEIKIDRSFIQQLPGGRDSSLVRMVTELGHHLGVQIVAEGVETDDQLAALREVGCDSLQGFLFGRPLTVENLAAGREEHSSGDSQTTLDETT